MQTGPGPDQDLLERVARCIAEGESFEVEFKGESHTPLKD